MYLNHGFRLLMIYDHAVTPVALMKYDNEHQ